MFNAKGIVGIIDDVGSITVRSSAFVKPFSSRDTNEQVCRMQVSLKNSISYVLLYSCCRGILTHYH